MSQAHELIAEFGNGSLNDRLTAAIKEVAEAVALQGKPGGVTLKLAFSEKAGGVVLGSTITTNLPKSKNEQFYFVAGDGELSRRDPNQPQLPAFEDRK